MDHYNFHVAIVDGKLQEIEDYLKAGINSKDLQGKSSLQVAIESIINLAQCIKVCKFLLENGAEANEIDTEEKSLLHYVLERRHMDQDDGRLMTLLINRGADINQIDSNGYSPLYLAVRSKYLKKLSTKSRSDDRLQIDSTSLNDTVENHEDKIIQLLLKYNVNVNDPHVVNEIMLHGDGKMLQTFFDNRLIFSEIDLHSAYESSDDEDDHYNGDSDDSDDDDNGHYVPVETLVNDLYVRCHDITKTPVENNVDMNYAFLERASARTSLGSMPIEENTSLYWIIKSFAIQRHLNKESLERSLEVINSSRVSKDLFQRLTSQLEKMKISTVYSSSHITYLDLFFMEFKLLKILKRCSDETINMIWRALYNDKMEELYPDFAERMRNNFEKALRGRRVRQNFDNMLCGILRRRLCHDVILHISDYLTESDVKELELQE